MVATLANSNVVVAWASFNQAASTSLQDVYAQVLSPTGQKLGGEFQVNQFISYNQRNPAIAALSDGRFVVAWVSEQAAFPRRAGRHRWHLRHGQRGRLCPDICRQRGAGGQ